LRNAFAPLTLMRGAPAKVIIEAPGHASVAFTFTPQTYAHVLSGMLEKATALLDEVLPPGVNKKSFANLSPAS
jgi:site-specific recombinase XerD